MSQSSLIRAQTRREFLKRSGLGMGSIALAWLLDRDGFASPARRPANPKPDIRNPKSVAPLAVRPPQLAPKAKRVIYLHMSGAPPQHDLFDYKPKLVELHMQPCPAELLKNQRFAFIKGVPKLLGSPHKFR